MQSKRKKAALVPKPAVIALQLLGTWNRIAQGHVGLSLGCSCGVGTSNLRAQDFEEQILDYLQSKHGQQAGSIPELLTQIARATAEESWAKSTALLGDLERSLQSFEQQHSGR